jgi:hypothetical protein
LNHYGRRLGAELYRRARRSTATFLRELDKTDRKTFYFRHDSAMLAAPGY